MNHLPTVQRPFRDRKYPCVPLLCDHLAYGAKSRGYEAFCAFPEALGYNLGRLKRAKYDAADFDDTLSLLQAWLFFGILAEILDGIGVPFHPEDFIKTSPDRLFVVITTAYLPKYMYYWMAASTHSLREVNRQHARLLDSCLALHRQIVNAFSRAHSDNVGPSFNWNDPSSGVLLSLAILGESLNQAKSAINGYTSQETLQWSFPALDRALLEAGWCVGEIATRLRDCRTSYRLYLSTINRHILGRNHIRCTSNNNCRANQIDFKKYRTKHAPTCDGVGCAFVGPLMQEITTILEDGDIPLIALEMSTNPSTIEVVRYQRESEFNNQYAAISHVWSDGLGNPHENRLPICQLERIQSLINKTYTPSHFIIPFWIDTICVPLERKWKSLAIERMDRTYAEADSVLVLDGSLQLVTGDASYTELLTHVGHSAWMARLWTYQEGRLSQILNFQLKDDDFVHARGLLSPPARLDMVLDILDSEKQEEVLTHPNLLQLARALAYENPSTRHSLEYYAKLPKQDDPDEEEARLSAIQTLEWEEHNLQGARIWRCRLANEGLAPLTDADSDLKTAIFATNLEVIWQESRSSVGNMKGLKDGGIESIRTGSDRLGYRAALQLVDVCAGYRARTTSRLEDEAICLSVLLGLDVTKVLQIPVLHWRLKEVLLFIRSYVSLGPLGEMAKSLIDRYLGASCDKRMKTVLSQIAFFSTEIIFWDLPRLHEHGWRWAPASFMGNDPNIGRHIGGYRCQVSEAGLVISADGYSSIAAIGLRRLSFRLSSKHRASPTCTTQSNTIISLDFQDDLDPPYSTPTSFPSHWKCCRLRTRYASAATLKLWQDLPYRHDVKDMVVLVESSMLALPEANFGVLTSKYQEDAGITYLRYVALIEKAESLSDDTASHVGAYWLPRGRKYCLG